MTFSESELDSSNLYVWKRELQHAEEKGDTARIENAKHQIELFEKKVRKV
ncbi:MAG TPA: hypothetical protein VGN16_14655 [Acidobacteriaceae bacterium]|jgi:hypothetical protein